MGEIGFGMSDPPSARLSRSIRFFSQGMIGVAIIVAVGFDNDETPVASIAFIAAATGAWLFYKSRVGTSRELLSWQDAGIYIAISVFALLSALLF